MFIPPGFCCVWPRFMGRGHVCLAAFPLPPFLPPLPPTSSSEDRESGPSKSVTKPGPSAHRSGLRPKYQDGKIGTATMILESIRELFFSRTK